MYSSDSRLLDWSEKTRAVLFGVANRHGQPLKECKCLVAECCLLDLHAAGTDQILQNSRRAGSDSGPRRAVPGCRLRRGRCGPRPVRGPVRIPFFHQATMRSSPTCARAELLARDYLAVRRIEELAVEHRGPHACRDSAASGPRESRPGPPDSGRREEARPVCATCRRRTASSASAHGCPPRRRGDSTSSRRPRSPLVRYDARKKCSGSR